MAYLKKNSHVGTHLLAAPRIATNQFCWTGQLVSVVPGKKSPRQSILLKVACVHYGNDALLDSAPDATHSVSLGKSLRRMMAGYLSPLDWLRVVGKCKVDADSGELMWKAQEIIKLSAEQVQSEQVQSEQVQSLEPLASKPQRLSESAEQIAVSQPPVRVFVCQQSSCRQRGSAAVGQVIGDALNASTACAQVSVQAVGCLKNCKLGPNVRLFPKRKLQSKGLKTHYDNVTPAGAKEIADRLNIVLDSWME